MVRILKKDGEMPAFFKIFRVRFKKFRASKMVKTNEHRPGCMDCICFRRDNPVPIADQKVPCSGHVRLRERNQRHPHQRKVQGQRPLRVSTPSDPLLTFNGFKNTPQLILVTDCRNQCNGCND